MAGSRGGADVSEATALQAECRRRVTPSEARRAGLWLSCGRRCLNPGTLEPQTRTAVLLVGQRRLTIPVWTRSASTSERSLRDV
eukprot:3116372-Alexandrium_andersonii.AAC.1